MDESVMSWKIYSDAIEGEHFQRILPAVNEACMRKFSELIGGVTCRVESFLKGKPYVF